MKHKIIQYTVTPASEIEQEDFQKLTQEDIDKQFSCTIVKTLAASVLITVTYDDKKVILKADKPDKKVSLKPDKNG